MKDIEVFVVKEVYAKFYEDYFLVSRTSKYRMYCINLSKLYKGNKSYLFSHTDDVFENYNLIEDKDVLFDEEIGKYIKKVFEKSDEILERAKLYDKEKEYKEIIDCTKEQYGILMEDKNGN